MNDPIRGFRLPPDAPRVRLDRYLSETLPEQSRSQIQGWIRRGAVRVNDAAVKTGYMLHPGDTVTLLELPQPSEPQLHPENLPLVVLYKDEDVAVVDKPAGMVCHPGAGVRSGTLVNALLFHLGPLETGDPTRPGIVHRLDKLTSGLLVVARHSAAHRDLARQFKSRLVAKEYLALVYGHPAPPAGTVDLPLGRDLRDRKKISSRSRRRRSAVTHYRTQSDHGPFSLLRVTIETGRTHQIRVHLATLGHPVVGDSLYGGHRHRNLTDARIAAAVRDLHRQFLHACLLAFCHPRTGRRMSFTSPLPSELSRLIDMV